MLCTRCVRSFQNKDLLEIFPLLSNNYRKTSITRTGTEIVNPCIELTNYNVLHSVKCAK